MAFRSSIGVTAPVICPPLSTAIDLRRSNSNFKPMMFPVLTTKGVDRGMVTLDCVRVTAGEVVPFSVLIVGRAGGVTFKYSICGFASVAVTLVYVPAGDLVVLRNVRKAFIRAATS